MDLSSDTQVGGKMFWSSRKLANCIKQKGNNSCRWKQIGQNIKFFKDMLYFLKIIYIHIYNAYCLSTAIECKVYESRESQCVQQHIPRFYKNVWHNIVAQNIFWV